MKTLLSILIITGFASCLQTEPPKTVSVEAPVTAAEHTTIPDGIPVLLFIVKGEKLYYKFDSSKTENNLKEIRPATKEEIVKAITTVETTHSGEFKKENIFVKSDTAMTGSTGFKNLKEALKEKQYLGFRIVTTAE